jgi:eukaryotic-like serine/threonine-protein kinase
MSDPNIGRLLIKRYQLQEIIGTGAMGKVYRAKDILLGGVDIAIKFLALSIQHEKMRLQDRFEREAKTCALLGQRSIHIVRVMDYGVDENGTPFYVMEYLQGRNLSSVLRNQLLPIHRFTNIARQIGLGLQCAHNGIPVDGNIYPIIHRDIKPSNIMIMADPSFGELVKILDFGISKQLQENQNQTNFYLGTLAYSSPEQMEGKELDMRSDIYSLGVMMFEMLTGKMPLVAPTHSFGAWYKAHHYQKPRSFAEVAPQIQMPKQLEQLVMSCLSKITSERPQNIEEIITILNSLEANNIPHKSRPNIDTTRVKQDTDSKKNSSSQPSEREASVGLLSHDEITRSISWPNNKPISDIIFPQTIPNNGEYLPAIWIMLPQAEIQKRLICTRYNQFLFITSPYPMLLWITVIYNRKNGAKWLPSYIDLKNNINQQMITLLANAGYYRLLFFTREEPHKCIHIQLSSIAPTQRQRLHHWLSMAKTLPSTTDSQISKNLLKREYEKIKPQIIGKLEAIDTDSPFDLSG